MSKILFMSVGTGLGKTNQKESLAQGLAFSTLKQNLII